MEKEQEIIIGTDYGDDCPTAVYMRLLEDGTREIIGVLQE